MTDPLISRRAALRLFGGATAAVVLGACGPPSAGPTIGCATTTDHEGPFFLEAPANSTDLTLVSGPEPIYENPVVPYRLDLQVTGGSDCGSPLSGATVDLWHADPDGHYDVKESSPGAGDAVPDDEVQTVFRTQLSSDGEGRLSLVTYVPFGYYDLPQHVHVKVRAADHHELTTQLYFAGDPKLDNLSEGEREAVGEDRLLRLVYGDDGLAVASAVVRLAPSSMS